MSTPRRTVTPMPSRRGLLAAVLVGGAAGAVGLLTAGPAQAGALSGARRGPAPRYQVPGVDTEVDISHATPEVARRFDRYFTAKSAHDVEGTMAFFSRDTLTYADATVGFSLTSWQQLHDLFAGVMPTWAPEVLSYPTRIVGDSGSAIVEVTTTPGAFAPTETRISSSVEFLHGRVVRWVDYWDGRHITLPVFAQTQVPREQRPTDFGESRVTPNADPVVQRRARALARALADGDAVGAVESFSADAVFEDATAHLTLSGRSAIEGFLSRAAGRLPYASAGAAVRHIVGGVQGGGWEWTSPGAVSAGVNVLELDRHGLITRFTAVWDGSLASAEELTALAGLAVES